MADPPPRRGSDHVYDALVSAGVELAVGIPGRGSLPLDTRIVEGDDMAYVLARHETAIPYIAWGYFEAGGGLAATITVPGPGDTNAAGGLRNAVIDQVPMLHLSSEVPPVHRGKGFIHEIDPSTYDHVVKANLDVRSRAAAPGAVARAIETARTPPLGPVRVGMPFLTEPIEAGPVEAMGERTTYDTGATVDRAVGLLEGAERPVVYVGVGAARSPTGRAGVAALVDALDAPVLTSYKGKGVFDETDDRWLGTSGHQLPAGAVAMLDRADVVLALGTEFTGPTTQGWGLPMGERLIHVTRNAEAIDRAYEAAVPIVDDPGAVAERLAGRVESSAARWDGAALARRARAEYLAFVDDAGMFEDRSPAPTPATLRAIGEVLPREAILVGDIAELRTWALQLLPASHPAGFITADAWTSMGYAVPGAIGAKLAQPDRPVVALAGDGGFMMAAEELHTAAQSALNVVVVVFNNGRYAMIDTAPELGGGGLYTFDPPDFASVAEGFGAGVWTAETPSAAAEAVAAAIGADGPQVVDVRVDPEEASSMDAWGYDTDLELP